MDPLRSAKQLTVVIAALLLPAACSFSETKDDEVSLAGTKSFALINQHILQAKCMSCHSTANAPSLGDNKDLSSYAAVMASGTVVAGSPTASSLWTEPNSGSMPKNGSKLPADHIQAIYDWIQDGARNN
jgi:hypothetical protein